MNYVYKLILRLARSLWQTNHSPDSCRKFNQASNNLKQALYKLRNAAFTNYITNLHRDDYSIWRPIRSNKKSITQNPPIRKNYTPWQLGDKGQGKSPSVCQLSSWRILSAWSGDGPGHRTELDKLVHPQKPTSLHDAPTNTGDQKAKNTKGSWRRTCYDSNAQVVTARRTHLPPTYL